MNVFRGQKSIVLNILIMVHWLGWETNFIKINSENGSPDAIDPVIQAPQASFSPDEKDCIPKYYKTDSFIMITYSTYLKNI